jgi:hypothetical protein
MPTGALVLAMAAVMIGLLAVVPVQKKVQRNHHLEELIESADYRAAIDYASGLQREDFSGIHYLPPDPFQVPRGNRHHYVGLLEAFDGSEASWLRELWMDQYAEAMLASRYGVGDAELESLTEYPELRERIEQGDEEARDGILEQLEEFRELKESEAE